jgi:hypothetical protein
VQQQMAYSFFGLILVALVGLAILAVLILAVVWVVKGAGALRLGHAMLACPHCSAETPANLEKCQKCGQELR